MTKTSSKPFGSNTARLLCGLSLIAGLVVCNLGCQQAGMYPGGYPAGAMPMAQGQPAALGPASVYAGGQNTPQLVELQRRASELDNNNRQLTAQIAQVQQQATAYRERADLLARQLEDANRQNAQLLASSQQLANQARNLQAGMTARGGARLTANNSMANNAPGPQISGSQIPGLQIPGAQVIPEGNGIRVRVSSDQMFAPGTVQLTPIGMSTLDSFVQAISRQYPRQRIGIEAHTDSATAAQSGTQMVGAQAQTVMDYLSQRGGIPIQQMAVSAPGPNIPIADNQTPAGRAENRRIEMVIYPN